MIKIFEGGILEYLQITVQNEDMSYICYTKMKTINFL